MAKNNLCANKKQRRSILAMIIQLITNNDYRIDYEYFSKHYKLIAIDLSKQIELENPDLK